MFLESNHDVEAQGTCRLVRLKAPFQQLGTVKKNFADHPMAPAIQRRHRQSRTLKDLESRKKPFLQIVEGLGVMSTKV
jgi:hypothetical protein